MYTIDVVELFDEGRMRERTIRKAKSFEINDDGQLHIRGRDYEFIYPAGRWGRLFIQEAPRE